MRHPLRAIVATLAMLAQAVLQGAEPASHPTKSAAAFARRTVIVDAGPLEAAIDRSDVDHTWAVHALRSIPARFITCEAAITEAQHGLENHWAAVQALRRLVGRMEVVSMCDRRDSALFLIRWSSGPQGWISQTPVRWCWFKVVPGPLS